MGFAHLVPPQGDGPNIPPLILKSSILVAEKNTLRFLIIIQKTAPVVSSFFAQSFLLRPVSYFIIDHNSSTYILITVIINIIIVINIRSISREASKSCIEEHLLELGREGMLQMQSTNTTNIQLRVAQTNTHTASPHSAQPDITLTITLQTSPG